MVEATAEQLAAAHAENKHLRAALEERDNTISQLRQEVQELSETVGLQAQSLREQEAALHAAVRGPGGGREADEAPRAEVAHVRASRSRSRERVWVGGRHSPQ